MDVDDNLDLVPTEYLEPPHGDDVPHILRDQAAELLDGYLRRLARQEALGRRVLGRLAARFLDERAHHALGFARVSDYSRERLGVSGRELQLLARVARRLEALPVLAEAFERGHLNWTKLRLLADVARLEDEHAWVELARGLNATELAQVISQQGANTRAAEQALSSDASVVTPAGEASDAEDEPRVRVKLSCPRWVAALWRLAHATASKVAGAELCAWQAAEAIAAEGLSGATPSLHGRQPSDRTMREAPGADRAASDGCEPLPPGYGELAGDPFTPSDLEALREDLDRTYLAEAMPARIEALAEDLHSATPRELDARLRAALGAMQRTDWQIGCLLRTFFSLRLHLYVGFSTSAAYITDRLGMSVRKARGLCRLENQCLRRGLGLTEAYKGGRISWCRAHALLPVLTETNAESWLERAGQVTLRRLVDEVSWALDLRDTTPAMSSPPPPPPASSLNADRYGAAMQFGARPGDVHLGDLSQEPNPGTTGIETDIVFMAPQSVAELLDETIERFREGREPRANGLMRLLRHVLATWNALPRHRDPVFERDGWRCRVPACSSRRNLQDHHVVFRSRGGDNAPSNRVAVCAWHHLRGIHAGRIGARHTGDGRIAWSLGWAAGGRALLTTVDDSYSSACSASVPDVDRMHA